MKQLKISLGSWAFSFGPFSSCPWDFHQVARYASEAGYDGIEINGFLPHPHPEIYDTEEKCAELKKELENLGLGVSAYAPDFTMAPPSQCSAEEYQKVLKSYLWFCDQLDIRMLRVDTVSPPEELEPAVYEQRYQTLVKNWKAAAQEAAKHQVRMVWEFEPGFWLNKPSEVKKLVTDVGEENFKVLFDTSHAYMGSVVGARHTGEKEILPGGVDEYIRLLENDIGHLHFIDSNGKLHDEETSIHEAFGKGYVDFPAVVRKLSRVIDRLDWVCVDFCFNPETPQAAREAIPYLKRLFAEAE